MQGLLRPLILCAGLLALVHGIAWGQVVVVCPGEPVIFQVAGEYYGIKTWEYAADGLTWTPVEVTENEPVSLQPEQAGWYRVRFQDVDCDTTYVSAPVRFALPKIDLGAPMTLNIRGQVTDEEGLPVMGATVRTGCGTGPITTTDHHGVFQLEGAVAYEELAYITVEKEGFFPGSRSFVPAENAEGTFSQVHITLLLKNVPGFVNSISGGTVTFEGLSLSFPPNAFLKDGQPFAGIVHVALNHIDPTSDDLHAQMPGMLMGVEADEPQLLLSYGMVGVELTDAVGEPLELAPGSLATVRFPVMPDQQANAPAVMPLWWFDEALGYWVREGEALLEGDEYVGQVAHFSWWNCDVPSDFFLLRGAVLDQSNNTGLANAQVRLISPSLGSSTLYTNGLGEFTGQVPAGGSLTLQIWLPCGSFGANVMVHEELVGPITGDSDIVVLVDVPSQSIVMGQVLDCAGSPVEQGYVWANGHAVFCVGGAYQFISCADSVTVRGVDMLADQASELLEVAVTMDTTLVQDLVACVSFMGTVMDIDGNVYPTILIGDQEWMAANLTTSRYRNGTPIPNEQNWQWSELNSGAWCNWDNDPGLGEIYGKLYNWYAVTHPSGLCPMDWHVPTDAEWMQLELALGMPSSELYNYSGYRGEAANVGGKLKATVLWDTPNVGATNVSGFSGLPGGYRESTYPTATFGYLTEHGQWWTASSDPVGGLPLYRELFYYVAGIRRASYTPNRGLSVRCVRD